MARNLSIAGTTYPAGTYGPFTLTGGFNKNNSSELEVRMSIIGWPTTGPLFRLSIQWDDRSPTVWEVVPSDPSITEAVFKLALRDKDGTDALSKMTVLIVAHQPITTAISARVI